MAFQYGVALRTSQVAQIQSSVGSSGTLKLFSGAEPANCASADPAGLLATITLPATFMTSASGATTIAGTWSAAASASGTVAAFRIYDGSSVCHVQGSVSLPAGSGDMKMDNTNVATNQVITVNSLTITAGGA